MLPKVCNPLLGYNNKCIFIQDAICSISSNATLNIFPQPPCAKLDDFQLRREVLTMWRTGGWEWGLLAVRVV